MGSYWRMAGLLALVAAAAAAPSAQKKPEDPLEPLRQAQQRLEATIVNRVLGILEAEAAGKDVRTDLEKSRDRLAVARWNLAASDAALAGRPAAAALNRQSDILEAKNKGKDICTDLEKARDAQRLREPIAELAAARKRLQAALKAREEALATARQAGKDIRTELEQAVEKHDTGVMNSTEYQAALKRLKAAGGEPAAPDGALAPGRSPPYRVAWTRLEAALKR